MRLNNLKNFRKNNPKHHVKILLSRQLLKLCLEQGIQEATICVWRRSLSRPEPRGRTVLARHVISTILSSRWLVQFVSHPLAIHTLLSWRWYFQSRVFITARKRSLRRLCFYRCLSVHRGGVHGCSGGHAWLLQGGSVHGCSQGGMHGCSWGACVVAPGGACMVTLGGTCMVDPGGRAWFFWWDTVNERAIRILLECILVLRLEIQFTRIQTLLIKNHGRNFGILSLCGSQIVGLWIFKVIVEKFKNEKLKF